MNDHERASDTMPTRRHFLKSAMGAGALGAFGFPTIVPATVFGRFAPSNLIQVAQIGCGRIGRTSEIPGVLRHSEIARFVAVCDLDTVRLADGKAMIEEHYARKFQRDGYANVKTFGDYRELLADKSIDAVCISTPDHWHAQPAIEAALAGKDIYVQKPAALTIHEGRQMADTIKRTGRILQLGSQQRSEAQFRLACELVRNGRIGKITRVAIGLPVDPAGDEEPQMPVPSNLNYDMWLGSTPAVFYTEKRVHPQSSNIRARYDRPGWLRCEQFGAGMITGWGAHHLDIAQWAMGLEHSGPVSAVATAEFPKKGLWDVHGSFQVVARYANGATMFVSDRLPTGIKFVGEDGWIWVTRGTYPVPKGAERRAITSQSLAASDSRILASEFKEGDVRLHASPQNDHHLDWLTSIQTRQPPVAPAEDGHRACTACLVSHAAMKLGRMLVWDPEKERFGDDEEANALLSRPQRKPYGTDAAMSKEASHASL
jgi:predicted dehydrogenase